MSTFTFVRCFAVACLTAGPLGFAADAGSRPATAMVQLKDMHLVTELVSEGRSRCKIVVPEGETWDRMGRTLQTAFQTSFGVRPEMIRSNDAMSGLGDGNAIVLGSADNNQLIRRLYIKHYCFTDCEYPGKGGAEVRTIHNPLGQGRNYVLLGGSDAAGVEAALTTFITFLADRRLAIVSDQGRSVRLARLNWSVSPHNHAEPDEARYFRETTARLRQKLDSGVVVASVLDACEAGMCYYQTGRDVYGRVFRDLLLHYCDLAEPDADWVLMKKFGGDSDRYFFPLRLIPVWNLIETGDVFTDAERLRITNLLLQITRWVSRLDYFDEHTAAGKRYGWPGEIRNNHATFATLSLFNGCEYFSNYYPEAQDWTTAYANVAKIFDGQRGSYRPDDNSATYFNYAPNHFLDYLFSREDWTYMEKGKLRNIADLIIMTVDNRSDLSTYGDEIEYKIGFDKGLPLLAKAAWYYKDGRYLWARDWLKRRSASVADKVEYTPMANHIARDESKTDFTYDGWYDGPYNIDLPRTPPDHLLGIKAMPMDEGLYRFARKYGTPETIPLGQTFDKMSWRRDFDPQDEYLLMGGFSGALSHSHEDGNALIRLTWKDRVWLADMHYRRKRVDAHNSLLVLRDWKYKNIPTFTSLDARVDFPTAGFTATTVTGYNGVDWTRNIVWNKGKYFLVLDDVRVREKGDYQLTLNWRTLGNVAFKANTLNIEQDGETFKIANADDSRKFFSEEPSDGRFVVWTPYSHTHDGVVKIMSEGRGGTFAPDERLTYINLLGPGSDGDFQVKRIQPRVVEVRTGRSTESIMGLADNGCRVGDLDVIARLFRLDRGELTLIDGTRLSAREPLLTSEHPVSLRVDFQSGEGTLIAATDTVVALRGAPLSLDDRPATSNSADGLQRIAITRGTHRLKFVTAAWRDLASELDREHPALPSAVESSATADAGLEARWHRQNVEQVETGDLDGDGEPDIVASLADRVVGLSAEGDEKWQHKLETKVRSLHLCDVDHDGKTEVIVGTEGGVLHVLDAQGSERWRQACPYRPGPITAIATASLAGDGTTQILAGSQGYVLYAFENDGRLRWYNMIDIPWGGVAAIVAQDLDGDGKPEIFIGTGADHGDVLLSGEGRKRWRLSGTTKIALTTDLAGDRKEQIIVGGPMQAGPLRSIDSSNGSVVWNVGIDDDVKAIIPLRETDEGKSELLVGYAASGLWRVDSSGGKWRIRSFPSLVNTVIPLANGRSVAPEFAVGCEDGSVFVVDETGTIRASLAAGRPVTAIRSFQDGGKTCLFVATRGGAATAMELTGKASSYPRAGPPLP